MHFFRLRLVAALLVGITLISLGSTYFDVLAHKHSLRRDLERRIQWYGAAAQPQIEQLLKTGPVDALPKLLQFLRQYPDQPSLAVYDTSGQLVASTGDIDPLKTPPAGILKHALTAGKESSAFVKVAPVLAAAVPGARANASVRSGSASSQSPRMWYEEAMPLHDGQRTVGALVMVMDADYIGAAGMDVWRRSFLRIVAMTILIVVVTVLMVRWFLLRPVTRAADWLRRLRQGDAEVGEGAKEFGYLMPLANEVTSLAENLTRARAAAEAEARLLDAA